MKILCAASATLIFLSTLMLLGYLAMGERSSHASIQIKWLIGIGIIIIAIEMFLSFIWGLPMIWQ